MVTIEKWAPRQFVVFDEEGGLLGGEDRLGQSANSFDTLADAVHAAQGRIDTGWVDGPVKYRGKVVRSG